MKKEKTGKVFFVGAGPGDPGLLTLRGRRLLAAADGVVYDWLVNPEILEHARSGAELIPMGKHPSARARARGRNSVQEKINRLLVSMARSGKKVVRLKGGDPLLFARGAEEALFLKKNAIAFEFVPGVTAGLAVPAYAGIPLTDRNLSSVVTFVTGHENPRKKCPGVDWKRLAAAEGTIVVFMSAASLPEIVCQLLDNKRPAATRVSVIQWGTYGHQKVVEGTLADIAGRVKKAGVTSPALTVIGEVNRRRRDLNWFDARPLAGKTVLITRSRHQSGGLKQRLEEWGARVLEFPAIRILKPRSWKPLDRAVRGLADYDWVLFTSTNAVEHFFARLQACGLDSRALAAVRVGAVGQATADALKACGICCDLMPRSFHAGSLAEALMKKTVLKGKRFLLPRADIAPDLLPAALRAGGASVDAVCAYRTARDLSARRRLQAWLKSEKIDFALFTSSSTVQSFVEAAGKKRLRGLSTCFISIGPMTSRTLRASGLRVYREARPHSLDGLLEAITRK